MALRDISKLTGLEKAGILLVSLGTSVCAEIFKHLTESEIEVLSNQIIRMSSVDPEIVSAVIAEFETQALDDTSSSLAGGRNFAAQVLGQIMDQEKAGEVLNRAASIPEPGRKMFEGLSQKDPDTIFRLLRGEHPQIIALVLTFLSPELAANVMSKLDAETQSDVAYRICVTGEVDLEVLALIEDSLQSQSSSPVAQQQVTMSAGPDKLVEILNNAERATERNVLDTLQGHDPSVGEQVRGMLVVFEDIVRLENRSVQLLLREVDQEDLRLALSGAGEDIKSLIFRNMSERAVEMLKEDLELLGAAKPKDVEAAQQKMVRVVRRLLASGDITMLSAEEMENLETDVMEVPSIDEPDQTQIAA